VISSLAHRSSSGSAIPGSSPSARTDASALAALERLLADERHVQRDGKGTPFLLDPLLAEWLRRR
jgi:hypothetical protein